jgi:hypothetical protein
MIETYVVQATGLTNDLNDARLELVEEGVRNEIKPLKDCLSLCRQASLVSSHGVRDLQRIRYRAKQGQYT